MAKKKTTTKTAKTPKRSRRKTASDASESPETNTSTEAQADEKTTKKATRSGSRKKTTKKAASPKKARGAESTTPTSETPTVAEGTMNEADVAAAEAAAKVEHSDNGIVIRFPSARPPSARRSASPEPQAVQPAAEARPAPAPIVDEDDDELDYDAPAAELAERDAFDDFDDELEELETAREAVREIEEDDEEEDDAPAGAAPRRPEQAERRAEDDEGEGERGGRRRRRRRRRRGGRGGNGAVTEEQAPPVDRARPEPAGDAEDEYDTDDEDVEELFESSDAITSEPDVVLLERDEDEDEYDDDRRRRFRRGRRPRRGEKRREEGAEVDVEPAPARKVRREMIINVVPRDECRIAILENGRLEEIYIERASSENHVGNIYKGVVTNVEPGIQAAFVDFGLGKNGFLHISDLNPTYFPRGEGRTEQVGRKMPRRARPPIQKCLRRGQEVIVQITKEGIGTKGPTLSTYISIPGRFLVMMPGMRKLGVSRKIEDDDIRSKLRTAMNALELPGDMGFIARTAASDRPVAELQNDLNYLMRLWRAVEKRTKREKAPAELYRESDLVIRTIRDVFTDDIERIIVDESDVAERAQEFLSIFSPNSADIIQKYTAPEPIFHKYRIEDELERLHSRHVPLPAGGSLVIDQAEALVAIDVNSGKFRTGEDAEATALKINLEAADEIARQLRLRDMGGVIVCDFIDMREDRNRRAVERRLINNLKQHKERAKVLRMSSFGMIEMTRQRQRASLTRSVYQDCQFCRGYGLVKTPESVALDIARTLQFAVTHDNIRTIEVKVSPEVAFLLQNRKRAMLYRLEQEHNRVISIRQDHAIGMDHYEIQYTDPRGRLIPHP